jgi:hypothetical protein
MHVSGKQTVYLCLNGGAARTFIEDRTKVSRRFWGGDVKIGGVLKII